jgi:hypothetical protein
LYESMLKEVLEWMNWNIVSFVIKKNR